MLYESKNDIRNWDETTNHKPPYVYEYMFEVGKTKYVVTAQILKDNKRIAYVTFGRVTAKRMLPLKFKTKDYKKLFETIYAIMTHIRDENNRIRGFIFSFPSSQSRVEKTFMMAMKRVSRKYPKIKFKLYKRESEDRIDLLFAKIPFTDMHLLGKPFEEVKIALKPMKRVRKVKKVKAFDGVLKDVEYEFIKDVEKVEELVNKDPEEFDYLGDLYQIDRNYLEDIIEGNVTVDDMNYKMIYTSSNKYLKHTKKHKDLVKKYTETYYVQMNGFLRGNGLTTFGDIDLALQFLDAFEEAPSLEESMMVLRTIGTPNPLKNMKIGDYYVDPGFLSTSIKLFNVNKMDAVLRIFLPKGTKVIIPDGYSNFPEEFEITLGPGSVLKIVSKWEMNSKNDRIISVYDMIYIGNIRNTLKKEAKEKIEKAETAIKNFKKGDVFNYYGNKGVFLGDDKFLSLYDYTIYGQINKNKVYFNIGDLFNEHIDIDYDIVEMDESNVEIGGIYALYGGYQSRVFKVVSKNEKLYPETIFKEKLILEKGKKYYKFKKFPNVFGNTLTKEYTKEILENEKKALTESAKNVFNFFVKIKGKYYVVESDNKKPVSFDHMYDYIKAISNDVVFEWNMEEYPKSKLDDVEKDRKTYYLLYNTDTKEVRYKTSSNIIVMNKIKNNEIHNDNIVIYKLTYGINNV